MEGEIKWLPEEYSVADLVFNKAEFPMLVKVAGKEEEDTYDTLTEGTDPKAGQVRNKYTP